MAELLETWAVIVAAGSGTRLGADVPKAFVGLGGRALLARAVELFEEHDAIDRMVVVVPAGWEEPATLLADQLVAGKVAAAVTGGATRAESVALGLAELPPDAVMAAKFREACERIESKGTAARRSPRLAPKPELAVPQDFAAALRENRRAAATFEAFPPSQRREYIEWVSDAKQDATRAKRLATSIEWLAEGKRRNWKYETR